MHLSHFWLQVSFCICRVNLKQGGAMLAQSPHSKKVLGLKLLMFYLCLGADVR